MNDHHEHHAAEEGTPLEYAKFSAVILFILIVSWVVARFGLHSSDYMRLFMAIFFLVFAGFKLLDLPGFATSYIGYDIVAKRSLTYAYVYPFIELALGFGFLFNLPGVNLITLILMIIGSIGVTQQLLRKSKIKCACLGTYIKLPLTTVSLVEDLTMGFMALWLLVR